MSLITCGNFSLILILPLISAILNIVNYEIFRHSIYIDHPIISCIITNTILSLFFIAFLFRKYICNRKNGNEYTYKVNLKIQINHPLILTIILGIAYEIVNLFHTIFAIKYSWDKPYFENDFIMELCFIHIIYKLFSTKIKYKHHVVSILFILLFSLGYYSFEFLFYKQYLILIFIIVKQIIVGICLVFIEYLIIVEKYSLFKIIFIFGLIGLLVDLIILLIVSLVPCIDALKHDICSTIKYEGKILRNLLEKSNIFNISEKEDTKIDYYLDNAKYFYYNFKDMLDMNGLKMLICTAIFSVFSALSIFFSFITIRKSSPPFIFFMNIIISLYLKIREFFYDSKGEIYIILIQILLVLFILFWTFIYCELLELNMCGISDDTENNIDKRTDLDEERSSQWANNTIISDADVTMDKSGIK